MVVWVQVTRFSNFGPPPYILGIAEARKFKFEAEIDEYRRKIATLGQKVLCRVSRDPLLPFLDTLYISETAEARKSNFAAD